MNDKNIVEKIYQLMRKERTKGINQINQHETVFEKRKVPLELILPFGHGFGYAENPLGEIIGLKLGSVREHAELVMNLVCQLKSLKRLVIYSRFDLEIPETLSKLNLEMLWLGGTITKIPQSIFSLNLPLSVYTKKDKNPFLADALPKELFTRLQHAEDSALPGEPTIAEVELDDNLISNKLYPLISPYLKEFHGLHIKCLNLVDPPYEILVHGQHAIENYFSEREKSSLPLNEVKIILVGEGGAGKTSLVKKLMGEKFHPKETQTHGINIKKWLIPLNDGTEAKVNFWDFGGQEIMHSTHQFFLSKRSIYILVLDGRKDEDPEYWLQHIQSFGGDSPVFIALNKIDEHPAFDVNRRFLNAKYSNIAGFFRVSCSQSRGIEEVKESIANAIPTTSMYKTLWPRTWFNAKKALEEKSNEFISLDQYRNICKELGISDSENQDLLVDFLHDLGVILHFKDMRLLDTHVLNPRWVTEGVYRIINSELVAKNYGTLTLCNLDKCLKKATPTEFEYPKEKHAFLIDLMIKFELCYRLDEEHALIPDLLDIQEPSITFDIKSSLSFIFEYSYLPKSVMLRLIVRLNADIKDNTKWRTGLILKSDEFKAEALIRADEKAKRIYIYVNGDQKRDFFSTIRKTIWDINNSFEKFTVTELVPIPEHPDVILDYKELIGHEKAGREKIFVGRIGKDFDVTKLLNGVESPIKRAETNAIYIEGDYYAAPSQTTSNLGVGSDQNMEKKTEKWEKIVVYASAIIFMSAFIYLLVRNEPFADKNLVVGLRIFLCLTTAVLGATIPGLLKVDFSSKGLKIRAFGALALFVITYFSTPDVLN